MKSITLTISIVLLLCQNLFAQNNFYDTKTTAETEATIKWYFDTASIDPIEGIYKTTSGTFYKIAIKKHSSGRYLVLVLDSENKKRWKEGTVKAYIEISSAENIFSIRYILGDKSITETTAVLKLGTLLSMWLPIGLYKANEEVSFLKMYPVNKSESSKNTNGIKVTGSGFFISSDGLIATNAHVVRDAKKIEIKIPNNLGSSTYTAKLVLIDNKNDVAIIQIEDASFKEISPLPYGISENADIGEKSFTIGYPLNDVMGTNYKVTDGIISSKTGVADDIRYYQISVPIQPGNSGGPLFNSRGDIIGITTAKLNSKAIGIQTENVNYAIKAAYLSNLINMIPNIEMPRPTNELVGKELKEQIKVLKDFVCLIQVSD
ncbi:trypsin-like peptidase domain-containing protein [Phnomibacter sp. MR]|uniref:S1C family serine protease n=1 Tax=Phnomibacter sp. MR TaxID=3042318 RepID=UPI003A805F8E